MPQFHKIGLAVALTALVCAPQAQAAMNKSDAARMARLELSEYADHRCNMRSFCSYASYPKLTKYDCKTLSARAVRCHGGVDLVMDSEDYITGEDYCEANVTVRHGRTPRISGWSCLGF